MTWLTWRQFRLQGLVALVGLVAIAVSLALSGPQLAHLFDTDVAGCLGRSGADACSSTTLSAFTNNDSYMQNFFGFALLALPGLIGAFWGAPLLTRELEAGTHRLMWNQSVTRTRWLTMKCALLSIATAAAAGLFSLMWTWWSSPLDRVNANRITPPVFDQRGIDPIGWALFAFALGVTAGVLIRRTLPAMAATLAIFTAVRIAWPLFIRAHLIPPVHETARVGALPFDWVGVNSGGNSPMLVHVTLPGAWVLSDHTVNAAGHQVPGSTLFNLCPVAVQGGATKRPPDSCFIQHLVQLGYNRSMLTYQPASRFWALQLVETGALTAFSVLLATFCYRRIRHGKVS